MCAQLHDTTNDLTKSASFQSSWCKSQHSVLAATTDDQNDRNPRHSWAVLKIWLSLFIILSSFITLDYSDLSELIVFSIIAGLETVKTVDRGQTGPQSIWCTDRPIHSYVHRLTVETAVQCYNAQWTRSSTQMQVPPSQHHPIMST